ncbi:MAG: BatA domain-containing protein, partial [Planctomycetota bacterium]
MNFLNQPLAWGALAFAIPLILHILNRSRFREIQWGAMHLLESVVKVNHKRFRFEQLILLLVRCAIPALLALCLARPVLTGSRILAGDAPVSMVILLDTSYSMDATTAGTARFEKAIDAACAIVDATARGSEIAVIRTGGGPTPLFDQPIFDSETVVRR